MSTVTAIVNGSGSAGKTTLALALAGLTAATGRRVCVVDLDPQGNATTGAGCSTTKGGLVKALAAAKATYPADDPEDLQTRTDLVRRTLQHSPAGGFDVLGAGTHAELQERIESATQEIPTLLAGVLEVLDHDTILLDSRGDLGPLTRAAMTAADHVLAVTILGGKEIRGIPEVIALAQDLPGSSSVVGIVPSHFDRREVIDRDYLAALQHQWPELTTPPIRRTVATTKRAFDQGAPVPIAAPRTGISDDFRAVHEWLTSRGAL